MAAGINLEAETPFPAFRFPSWCLPQEVHPVVCRCIASDEDSLPAVWAGVVCKSGRSVPGVCLRVVYLYPGEFRKQKKNRPVEAVVLGERQSCDLFTAESGK